MDTGLARTFLAIIAQGSFLGAAERLHVSQSTVSARIRSLEEQLGCTLFLRNKAGTRLTAAGRRFQKHAAVLVRTAAQARQDAGVPEGFEAVLTVGGRFGLWEELLLDWLPLMRRAAPRVLLRAEIGFEKDLMEGLLEGRLDIAVMYTPESRPGLVVERLLEERLVLVASAPGGPPEPGPDYVLVDWGPEFRARHDACFPGFEGAGLVVAIGWLGLQHVLRHGGQGYFPLRLVETHLRAGRLHRLPGAPEFRLPAWMVHAEEPREAALDAALGLMRGLAAGRDAAG